MKELIFILLGFVCLDSVGQINFYKTYGGSGDDYGKSIVTTADTGYVVVGATESFGNGITDVYLFKVDSIGDFEWSRYFGGNNVDWGMDLVETVDKGFLICGYSNSGTINYDGYLIRTNSLGETLWERKIGGNDWDFFYGITKTNDGNYILAGETFSYGNGQSDAYYVKVNDNGDTLWTNTVGTQYKEKFNTVLECSNGDLLFVGKKENSNGDYDFWLVKTDALGNELWQFSDGTSLDDEANDVIELDDGNYFAIGYYTSSIAGRGRDIWYKKIRPDGTEYYDRKLYPNQENEQGVYALQYEGETDIYIGAVTETYGNGGEEVMSTKLTYGGGFISGTNYTIGTSGNEVLEAADLTFDSSVVLVGTTDYTVNGSSSIFIVKQDSLFQTPSLFEENLDVSISESEEKPSISVYPIPASSRLTISGFELEERDTYEITNNMGERIKKAELTSKDINVVDLSSGIYYIKIITSNQEVVLKFIKL